MKAKIERLVSWLTVRAEIGRTDEALEAISTLAKMEELGIIRRVYGTQNQWVVIE